MRSITVRRVLSSILLPVYLSSCTSWQVQSVSPEQVVEEEQPSQVRVTTTDESEVVLKAPSVSGDNLLGLGDGPMPQRPCSLAWESRPGCSRS
jgi:hypothetical protein